MAALNILVYISSLVTIWVGANLIVDSIDRFSKKLRLSTFSVSFFVLGLLTSIPEIAVGANSVGEGKAEIFVGNLIGGIAVLFLFVVPVIAIVGNGIKISHHLSNKILISSFVVMLIPTFFVLDKRVTNFEGLLMILSYAILFYFVQRNHGVLDHGELRALEAKNFSTVDIFKVLLGVILVFIASQNLVDKTIYLAELMRIPLYYVSLILLSVGTNIPELSLGLSAVHAHKKDVAFGDYVGSACANTIIFGVLTLVNDGEVLTVNNFLPTFIILTTGLAIFFVFTKSKQDISRKEGYMLLGFYAIFSLIELLTK
ncbi:sodium:calcium antiporter [candidate division WWE3 bacterium]|uniref:Sodium:calcium antiporter n=1 Tax=candidate division WWE3 bacterium TaxID=2053526 RepID=A0A7X9DKD4_UNCKA|nr:sodium:calcium antiporter [candidate division WWE3 bacterium]